MRRKTPPPPNGGGPGATRKERLLRAKMKKKIKEEAEKGQVRGHVSNRSGALTMGGVGYGEGVGDVSKNAVVNGFLFGGYNVGFEDILQMSDLSEENLLMNLRNRYERDLIYTFVGPIVIAINPYKPMDALYDEQIMKHYYGKAMGSLPPHVFALADHAYTQLIQGGALYPANQSIIISGESGAGKTETTKIIMQYLARATSYRNVAATTTTATINANGSSDQQQQMSNALGKLEERVLESNPLLESFGNAKTLRNDNSSRFGKFIEIQFNHHGKIVGAEIMNFLLEKTRIVSQSLQERNYHIFYQLLAGADDDLRERLELKSPQEYEYLRHSGCFDIKSVDEKEEFETTKRCMRTIGIGDDRQARVFELLAAVLHLGNVQFNTGEGDACSECAETSRATLELVAKLLGVSFDSLQSALVSRKLFVGGKVIVQSQTMDQVRDKRDALAKSIYSSVFLWLVSELNRTISKPSEKWGFIGVLDIYGFEKFEWNTFEQLCINYANEKLQRHFNQHMLEVEQEEYAKEGIDWQHIAFVDNQQCLDLIEGKPGGKPGILNTLDDIWRLKGEEANKKFVSLLHANFGRDPNEPPTQQKTQHAWYVHPKVDANLHFGIHHYAGDVIYDASGFNDKNNETLNEDMKELLRQSDCEYVREVFDLNMQSMEAVPGATRRPSDHPNFSRRPSPVSEHSPGLPSPNKLVGGSQGAGNAAPGAAGGKSRNLREVSVGAQFRFQLQELMGKISLANPRYVRCIKPNEYKQPGDLSDVDCARQLKYSGMMEAIQIRQRGFALREDHDVFFYDYQSLAPHAETIGDLVEHISTTLGAGKDQWQLGKSKVFLKRDISFKLRKLEVLRCKAAARTLQRWCRSLENKAAAIRIQCAVRQFLARKKLQRIRSSAYQVVGVLRTRVAVRKYRKLIEKHRLHTKNAIILQRYARGYLVRKLNLLKPFDGLTPQQLDDRIAAKEKEIAKAAAMKQFDLCNILQRELEQIVEARKKNRTRKELEDEISALQEQLANAMASKDFGKCASIQNDILELENMRKNIQEDLNELDAQELDERIEAIEKRIGIAMQERAFELCGELQEELEALKKVRKQKMTPEEIDVEIVRLNGELEKLLQQKEFSKCSEVQKQIDALKRKRSKMKPSPKLSPEPAPTTVQEQAAAESAPDPEAAPVAATGSVPPIHPGAVTAAATPTITRVSSQSDPKPGNNTPVIKPAQASTGAVRRTSMPATIDRSPNQSPSLAHNASDTPIPTMAKPHAAPGALARSSLSMGDLNPTNDGSNLRTSFVEVGRNSFEGNRPSLENSPPPKPVVRRTSGASLPATRHRSESGSSCHSIARSSLSNKSSTITKHADSITRAVERLVLAKPLTVSEHSSVQEAAELMNINNQAAVLVINEQGELAGILTDTDIAHRVVAKGLDTSSTSVGPVMTPSPKCIMSDEKAVDALNTMLRGKLRHLPVVSKREGHVLGVLNASSCLHDAIRTMEATMTILEDEKARANTSEAKLKLISMMQRLFSPSLKDILAAHKAGNAPLVFEDHSVRHATNLMASSRMPALVVSQGAPSQLVGIFTPKDLMHRVVAMGYDCDQTRVADVMTPAPESASPHTTSLDAFHLMYDGKFLSIPVVDTNTGEIYGVVDAISLCYATFCSSECPELGALWPAALGVQNSQREGGVVTVESRRRIDQACGFQVQPVSSLRPSPAITIGENASVFEASILMKQKRSNALLVIDVMQGGALTGILTDGDIARRVLAQKLKPEQVIVGDVMTRDIKFISPQESAIDALLMMKEGQFRHLPVVDQESGVIAGVLNIGECLYELSRRLEYAIHSSEKMQAAIEKSRVLDGSSSPFRLVVAALVDKMNPPTLASILQREVKPFMRATHAQAKTPALTHEAPRVHLDMSVAEVAQYLASAHKAALVVDDQGRFHGVFTPDEMVMDVIASRLDPWSTPVGQVMLPDPDTLYPTTSVVDALRVMYDSKLLYLPILTAPDASQTLVGLLDVLALGFGTIDAIYGKDHEDMRQFWNVALQLGHAPTPSPNHSLEPGDAPALSPIDTQHRHDKIRTVAELNPGPVQTISEDSSVQGLAQVLGSAQAGSALVVSAEGLLVGIVTDTDLALKVVAENRSPVTTRVGEIMTDAPKFVSAHEPAVDALCTMLEGRFRHLPVMDEAQGGSIVGEIDISKCLYEALTKMEKHEQKSVSLRQNLDRKASVSSTAASTSTSASGFTNMLGSMLEKYLTPDVKSLLDNKEPVYVQPYTSVFEVCKQMATANKPAALVVSNRGQFFGIFSPTELLVNVLAKGLPFQTTPVCEVMNEETVTIVPSCTVTQAMQTMYKHNTLYLAVLQSENSRSAIGIVDVLSLSYGSFARGQPSDWKAFWNASFELDDDVAPAFSPALSPVSDPLEAAHSPPRRTGDPRPVSKLRPTPIISILDSSNVADAAKEMSRSRVDAALILSPDGLLRGILTDTDVTRKVVALGKDPFFVNVCDSMTASPRFVEENESAMDAMFAMLDGKFRHLPVVDSQGIVSGMLFIQKCLHDAIMRLEKAQQTSSSALRTDLQKQLLSSKLGSGLVGIGNEAALQQLIAPMLQKFLSPPLEAILEQDHFPPLVYGHDTVMEVARQMAASRKGALIVEDLADFAPQSFRDTMPTAHGKKLIGIFTPRDLLLRVVGTGLDAANTMVSQVMTPNPETAPPSMSLLDAMHTMNERRIMHLPVVEPDTGLIRGMVDVLSLCYGSFAHGSHTGKGNPGTNGVDASEWRAFWDMSLTLACDDESEAAGSSLVGSKHSLSRQSRGAGSGPKSGSAFGPPQQQPYAQGSPRNANAVHTDSEGARPVSKLRPRSVTHIDEYMSVVEAAKVMRQSRCEAVVVTRSDGQLRGILTDSDITRRVLAQDLDPESITVASVMTSNPSCVYVDDPAIEAISKMMEGHFKHLPVLGTDGIIQGMLDISRCLYDAIALMEKVQQSTEAAADEMSRGAQRMLAPMMEKMVHPTISMAIQGEPQPPVVQVFTTGRDVAKLMAQTNKAAIVLDQGSIVGLVTFKDMLRRLVSRNLSADNVCAEDIMSADPECLRSDTRVLDGLRVMHESGQLFVPVLTRDSEIAGMADVLSLAYGQFANAGGASGAQGGWRAFWQSIISVQEEAHGAFDFEESNSIGTIEEFERSEQEEQQQEQERVNAEEQLHNVVPHQQTGTYSELGDSVSVVSGAQTSVLYSKMGDEMFVFKVSDRSQSHYHRLLCRYDNFAMLTEKVRSKMNLDAKEDIRLKYEDEDGDLALLSSDESLLEAVSNAKSCGMKRLIVLVDIVPKPESATEAAANLHQRNLLGSLSEDQPASFSSTFPELGLTSQLNSTASRALVRRKKQKDKKKMSMGGSAFLLGVSGLAAAAMVMLQKKT